LAHASEDQGLVALLLGKCIESTVSLGKPGGVEVDCIAVGQVGVKLVPDLVESSGRGDEVSLGVADEGGVYRRLRVDDVAGTSL